MGTMLMQNLVQFTGMDALGLCLCGTYCMWRKWMHSVCARAELIAFEKNESNWRVPGKAFIKFRRSGCISCVPMQNLLHLAEVMHCVCAHAEFVALGRSKCIHLCRIDWFWQKRMHGARGAAV